MVRGHFFMFGLVVAITSAAAADVIQPQPVTLTEPSAGSDLQNCAFITNDCEVCVVEQDGKPSCSSTGIACVPARRWCLIKK